MYRLWESSGLGQISLLATIKLPRALTSRYQFVLDVVRQIEAYYGKEGNGSSFSWKVADSNLGCSKVFMLGRSLNLLYYCIFHLLEL